MSRARTLAMAISSSILFVVLSLAFFCGSYFTYAISDVKASRELISEICSEATFNTSCCEETLQSDARSNGAELTDLGVIAIDLAESTVESTSNLVKSLEQQETDPKLKIRYWSCSHDYDLAIEYFKLCNSSLNNSKYDFLAYFTTSALRLCDDCEGNFVATLDEPQELKEASLNVQEFGSVILVITNRLIRGPDMGNSTNNTSLRVAKGYAVSNATAEDGKIN